MSERRQRHVRYTAALLFAVAAILQLNDPDPLGWVACYASAALVLILSEWPPVAQRRSWLRIAGAALGGVCLLWAALIWLEHQDVMRGALDEGKLLNSVTSMSNEHPENELYKEVGGLLIVAGVLLWNSVVVKADTPQ